jgi:uncharacterized protein (TIGR00661 family)
MKILYAVQATGNGHISRAMELLPHLHHYGSVDIFLSGNNSHLSLDAPVKYRSKGLSIYYNCNGGLDFWQLLRGIQPFRLKKEIQDLPVEKYDLVINDFEYITAAACAKKKIPSINFGHQASFMSKLTPRPPERNATGEWIFRNFARASHYVGLHFNCYDDFIFPPIVKRDILDAEPADKGFITVYLPSYCEPQLETIFSKIRDARFEIFSSQATEPRVHQNIRFLPVNKKLFNESLVNCSGIITGGGFETPAEAIHLGKKLLAIPIRNQYEQQCNAAALEQLGVRSLKKIDNSFESFFYDWRENAEAIQIDYSHSIEESLACLFSKKSQHSIAGLAERNF